MDRVASLLHTASTLQRKLFSSLPWGYRLATIFIAMDNRSIDSWSRSVAAYMLQAGVTGMPDPGPRWNPKRPNASSLPPGYMMDLGKKAYGVALKQVRNPEDTIDVMMDWLTKLVAKPSILKEGVTVSQASSFIVKGVDWTAKALVKSRSRRPSTSIHGEGDEGEETTLDLVDDAFARNPHWNENPREFRSLEEVFPYTVWEHEVVPALKAKVHEDMPLFFELLGDGMSAQQIVNNRMLPHFEGHSPQAWNYYVQKAKRVLREIADSLD